MAVAGCLACATTLGYEAKFSASTSPAEWGVATNWVDTATGETPALPPGLSTDMPDDVIFPELETPATRIVHTTKETDGKSPTDASFLPKINPVIGVLKGPWYYTINVSQPTDSSGQAQRWIKVNDPDGFEGMWAVDNGKAGYYLTADPGKTGVFHNVESRSRPFLNVVNANTTAVVENLSGNGMLLVNENGSGTMDGAGTVEIVNTSGGNQKMVVSAGAVNLIPLTDAEAAKVFDKAYLHVDASDASTFLTTAGADGRTYVTNWLDVRKNGMKAVPYTAAGANCPFRDDGVKSPTGLELLDFGSLVLEDYERFGPTNCVLQFPRTTHAREIFYVSKYQRAAAAKEYPGAVGDLIANDLHPDSGVLFGGAASANAKNGELQYNGIRCMLDDTVYNSIRLHNLCQIGIGCVGDITVSLLGATRYDAAYTRTGGVRIGEVLVYTQQLTRVERMFVARYLNRKWFGDIDADFGFVEMRNNRPLGVGEGAAAKVADLVVTGTDGLKKTGAGTLEVSRLTPQGSDVNLQGGALAFVAPPTISAAKPADNQYLWLDANTIRDADLAGGYLESWADCRSDVSLAATTFWTGATHKPTVRRGAVAVGTDDLDVVDLGLKSADTHAAIAFPNYGSADTYAMYMVFRQKVADNTRAIFGGSKAAWLRNGAGRLMGSNIQYPAAASALWTLNGTPIDPYGTYTPLNQTNEFVVVGVNSPVALALEGIANCGGTGGPTGNFEGGNLEIGEVLVYKRMLADDERLATEAYLMKRWLNKDHPRLGGQKLGTVTVADGQTLAVGGAADVEIATASGGTGALVKEGSGTLDVTKLLYDKPLSSVTVKGGTLKLHAPTLADLTDDALFHFDASDAGSFDTFLTDDGATTNVVHWKDTRANGVTTYCPISAKKPGEAKGQLVFTNPVVKVVEMRPGVFRPTVDFGTYSGNATDKQTAGSSGLNISKNGTSVNSFTTVLEAFTVFADTQSSHNFILTDSSEYHYHRGYSDAVLLENNKGTQVGAKDGYHAVDGVEVAYNYNLPVGFHVINFAPTNVTQIGTLAIDRTSNGGACQISETFALDHRLTLGQRKYVESLLMAKWFEENPPVWTNATQLAELTVAEGATLDAPEWAFTATTVGGSGTIKVAAITGISEIEVSKLDTASPAVTLTADVSISAPLTVRVTCEIPKTSGEVVYKLVKGLPEDAATGCTLDATLPRNRTAEPFMDGDTLCLRIRPCCLMLIVK